MPCIVDLGKVSIVHEDVCEWAEASHLGMVVDPFCASAFDGQKVPLVTHAWVLASCVDRECVDTVFHTLTSCLQHVIDHVVQLDQERV